MAHDTVSTTGSRPDNPTGQKGHPAKSSVVTNDQTGMKAHGGNDSFSEKHPKASVKLTTPSKVS